MNQKITAVNAKYIFLDIVGYTHERNIEAQTELITILNKIVLETVNLSNIPNEQLLYIPTGDGICIAFLDIHHPYDIHMDIAIGILGELHAYNESINDEMRKFSLRIGINENTDNLIVDINGRTNIAGSGINLASRIMNLCDPNQILVGRLVYEKLIQREKYMRTFTKYIKTIKHGAILEVYQFKYDAFSFFLNNDIPSSFKSEPKLEKELSKLIGYYFANCIRNEDFIYANNNKLGTESNILTILMLYLAQDSLSKSKKTKSNSSTVIQKLDKTLQEHFNNIKKTDFWILNDFSNMVIEKYLSEYKEYFEDAKYANDPYLFVNEIGRQKLLQEHPDICKEYGIE